MFMKSIYLIKLIQREVSRDACNIHLLIFGVKGFSEIIFNLMELLLH